MKAKSFLAATALVASGCTADFAKQNQASVILQIVKITGQAGGATGGQEGDVLHSDVIPIFNDNATLNFQSIAKDPNNVAAASRFHDILLERYEVVYRRSDGRNTEGVDVPYSISGGMATSVPANGTAAASIVVVRHQAKEEPPLRNLRFLTALTQGGGADYITVVAEITVHGRTTNGRAVTTSGKLTITFSDFADQ